MPAQGQPIENLAVPNGPVACRVGIPFTVVIDVVHPIKFRVLAASVAVVGTMI